MTVDDEFREAVLARICPVCGKGPFAMLAGHTSRAHGLTAWELRDQAGLIARHSITSPELREQRSAHGKENAKYIKDLRPSGHTLRRTRAGNDAQRVKQAEMVNDPSINAKRVAALKVAQEEKWADPEYAAERRKHLAGIGKRQAKKNRKRRECAVCGRKFWPAASSVTKNRKTCSEDCAAHAENKGLRAGHTTKVHTKAWETPQKIEPLRDDLGRWAET